MALLNERQEKAAALARELGKMDGTWVVSPLPLDDTRKLRLQISDIERNRVLQVIRDWGWDPVFVSVLPRICTTGLIGACVYEIDLPRARQDVVDDRIHGEIARPEKTDVERRGILKYLGIEK